MLTFYLLPYLSLFLFSSSQFSKGENKQTMSLHERLKKWLPLKAETTPLKPVSLGTPQEVGITGPPNSIYYPVPGYSYRF